MKIGFIGLGAMGKGIALQLIQAGHEVVVWNRSRGAVGELVKAGAVAAGSPAEAAQTGMLHSMLADDNALNDVMYAGGALAALPRGGVHVNHATISVALAKALAAAHAERGIGYVAAPVFGRPDAAAAGKLHVLVAGDAAAVARVEPQLAAIGQSLWPLGAAPERANIAKIAGNFMIASAIEAMAEATALTRAHGLGAADFLDVITGTLFAAPVYKTYAGLIAARRFSPAGFGLKLGYKDASLTLAAANDTHVPLPFANVLRDAFLDALANGDGDLDWSALSDVAARRAHLDKRG